MALAPELIPGFKYTVLSGLLEGEVVEVVDNKPFPDGDPQGRQRKVTVKDPHTGQQVYILPRMLSNRPIMDEAVEQPPVFAAAVTSVAPVAPSVAAPAVQVTETVTTLPARVLASVNPITDPMDKRLDHLRPSRTKVRRYVNRDMGSGLNDVEFFLTFTEDGYRSENEGRPANVMLKGDTQSGKTILVEALAVAWADKLGLPKPMPIFTLSGSSGITDYDLFGQTTSYTDPESGVEALVWLPGLADLAAQVGGILYLDEVNAFSERVTSSLHPLADSRHFFINRNKPVFKDGQFMPDSVSAHMDLWIIGTYNEGYRGMSEMNEAFINRFRHVPWGYDKDIEEKLIVSPAIRHLGESLRTARQTGQIRTPVGTSALQRLEQDIKQFGISLGTMVFTGMFKANERGVVEAIIEDRSIYVMLQEEQRQARQEASD